MMILHQIRKEYRQNQPLLHLDKVIFPERGIVALVGPSGCGKTTLLNMMAGLDGQYQGKIEINHQYLSKNTVKNESFRLEHIGYIMQHYGLFEEESALYNVMLPGLTLYHNQTKYIRQRALDLLKVVGLRQQSDKLVKHFSGGEKQRIAIARSLINQPSIILADEPTGALDSQNKLVIMQLLQQVSEKCLVIIVSHDVDLMTQFSQRILYLQQGHIVRVDSLNPKVAATKKLAAIRIGQKRHCPRLPLSFIFHHHRTMQKQHRIRHSLSLFSTALGLVGIGLGFLLSSTVTHYLKNNLLRAFPQQSIIITTKEDSDNPWLVPDIGTLITEDFFANKKDDISRFYGANYEQFFPNMNRVAVVSTSKKYILDDLSIRQVNEAVYIKEGLMIHQQITMPTLENDQVILGVNHALLNYFYSALRLPERRIEALRSYVNEKRLVLSFELANHSWQYADEQVLEVMDVVYAQEVGFYHSNAEWKTWFFKEQMRFPSRTIVDENDPPWTLNELVVIDTKGPIENFIDEFHRLSMTQEYIFERFTAKEVQAEIYLEQRLKVYRNLHSVQLKPIIEELQTIENGVQTFFPATRDGYMVFTDVLLSGFAHPLLLSTSTHLLETALDKITFDAQTLASQWAFDPGIAYGHYLQTTRGGFDFSPLMNQKIVVGKKPENMQEIVISTQLAKTLGIAFKHSFAPVILGGCYVMNNDMTTVQDPTFFSLSVVGMIQSDDQTLYQHDIWLDDFFRYELKMQNDSLRPLHYVWMHDDDSKIDHMLLEYSLRYPDFTFSSPTNRVFSTIDATMKDVQMVVFAVATLAIIISILLNSLVNYLSVYDSLYQVGLLGYLGVPRGERTKLFIFCSFIQGGESYLVASIELLVLQEVIRRVLIQELGYVGQTSLIIMPFIIVFAFTLFIAFISSLFPTYRLNQLSPIEAWQTHS